jgi:hypothetical protein
MQQPSIIILKEGTDTSQGKAQLISNINACMAVVGTIRTTLGPRGMDKLIYEGRNITISNDGATIMKLLDVVHPAARTLVDIARSQDEEVRQFPLPIACRSMRLRNFNWLLRFDRPHVNSIRLQGRRWHHQRCGAGW